jgi:hypothetical protein
MVVSSAGSLGTRPQPFPRRMQEPLPALRPGRVAEGGPVVPAPQLVATGLQPDTPAERQFRRGAQVPQHDRAVLDRRADYPVTLGHQGLVQALESFGADQPRHAKRGIGSHSHRPFRIDAFRHSPSVSQIACGHGHWFVIPGAFVPSRTAAQGKASEHE